MRSSSRVRVMGMRLPLLWMDAFFPAAYIRVWPIILFRNTSACGPRRPRMGGDGLPVT